MGAENDSELPPAYQELVHTGKSILQQVSSTRNQHIQNVVSSKIIPAIAERASKGLSKSHIALVPKSHKSGLDSSLKIIGPSDPDDSPHEVHLKDPLDTHEFWEQPQVLFVLRAILAAELSVHPEAIPEPPPPSPPPRPPVQPLQESTRSPSRGFSFWSRKSVASPPPAVLSRQQQQQQLGPVRPPSPDIKIEVEWDGILYRAENPFGLFESIEIPAVIIRVTTR